MSLKEFLAVGRSFAGSPRDKSPFAMRREAQLPIFENAPRFSAKAPMAVQTDWLTEVKHCPATENIGERHAASRGEQNRPVRKPARRSWLRILTFGLFGKAKPSTGLVQEEMSLENVRVMRNDLADSDLELVMKKRKRNAKPVLTPVSHPPELSVPNPAPRKRGEWSELSARLFEIGQQ